MSDDDMDLSGGGGGDDDGEWASEGSEEALSEEEFRPAGLTEQKSYLVRGAFLFFFVSLSLFFPPLCLHNLLPLLFCFLDIKEGIPFV